MNLDIKLLSKSREDLEKRYAMIEDEIYSPSNSKDRIEQLEKEEMMIEEQLNLLDQIIHNILNTPKLYRRFIKLNEEYGDKYE